MGAKGGRTKSRRPETERDELATSDELFGDLVDAPLPEGAPDRAAAHRDPVRIRVRDPVRPRPLAEATPPEPRVPDDVEEALSGLGPVEGPPAPPRQDPGPPPALETTGAKLQITHPKLFVGPGIDLASVAESGIAEPPQNDTAPDVEAPRTRGHDRSWRDDTFGTYRLVDRVAVGGMAEVFKAKRAGVEGFEKTVALKRILPHLSDNREFVTMFVDEAKMVAGLSHPNIVQIFDLGKIDKCYYIAMEYVHGRDLRTILRRAREKSLRMPLDLGLYVMSQVAAALDYAHRRRDDRGEPMQIVHRDVSPQNILISFEGDVKLVDFGIAKAATKASSTDRGALRGKLLYMSPEQAWGHPIDRRSDIFSAGIVLYEMVTEQKPFLGAGTEMSILEMVRQCVVVPPREVNPRVPEPLDRVIMKALARSPEDRYQDAAAMQRGVEAILRERPPVGPRDLARFVELLFDREERDEGDGGTRGADPAAEAPVPLSPDALLKRFGID
jgi:serine/threonine protein kinase